MEDSKRKEILFVDDDPISLKISSEYFSRSYFVHTLSDSNKAIEYIAQNPKISVVITDIHMPEGIWGIELLKELKQKWPHIIVIMSTGYASIKSAVESMKAGAFDYIVKPIPMDKLSLMLERIYQKIETESLLAHLTGRVFLCYARQDKVKVEELYDKLSNAGYHPWVDTKDLLPGERWENKIAEIIETSSFFIACLSNNSVNKRGMVQKELKKGLSVWKGYTERDIYIIPVRLEACSVPIQLREFQWVDLFAEDGWDNLLKSIRRGLEIRSHLAS